MIKDLRYILGAEAVSNFGSMLSRLAIPWIAALALAATPLQMGMLVVADVAAAAAGALLLGVVVDRYRKRFVMVAADLVRAAILGAVALLAWMNRLDLAELIVAAAASGLATTGFEMARSAWMAQRIEAGDLPAANARVSMAASVSETAAFALGGWLYQALGAVLALAVDAATYLASAAFVRGVADAEAALGDRAAAGARLGALLREAKAGIAIVAATPVLRTLAVVQVVVCLGMSLAATSYMIFVARDLGFGAGILGMIFATGAVGSLLGASAAARLGARLGAWPTMLAGLVLFALGAACIPLAPGATGLGAALLIAHQVFGDAGHTLFDVHERTLRQTSVAPGLLGRADAGIRTLSHLSTLVGALAGGILADALGTRFALVGSAALYAVAVLALLLRRPAPGDLARPVEARRIQTTV